MMGLSGSRSYRCVVWGETGALVDPDPRVLALVLYGPTPVVPPAQEDLGNR